MRSTELDEINISTLFPDGFDADCQFLDIELKLS
jgi:hypothetical protein